MESIQNQVHKLENETIKPLDPEEFRKQGHMVIDFLADYYKNIEKYPVRSQVQPGYLRQRLPESAPCEPEPLEEILGDVQKDIIPALQDFLGKCFALDSMLRVSTGCRRRLAGINPNNFRAVSTTKANGFGLTAEALRSTIEADIEAGLVPLFFCATIGTTSSASVDALIPLCEVAKEFRIWTHVDAAYAGSVCICPEFRHFLDGVENADSFSFNAHKWFFSTLDCCCLWVKNPGALIQALSTYPEYLRNKASESKQVVDYKDWQITLTRRFRSLKVWLVLRSYGVDNLRKFLRSHVNMAKIFEGLIAKDKRFEVVVPRNFSTVCFRISPIEIGKNQIITKEEATNNFNAKLLESINESGKIFMTHAVIGGVYVMRFALGASLTENRHVNLAWKAVQEHANALLNTS
ncbi:tyrosine DOPA decarboxylase 1-like [Olea europaea subsp. europaea]|uniref:Tyrosine DOPA decarboxylase 1-like n=1 Tax=Olea europaea subsp. europaea TaxID=158383 RepID=A0A8S0SCA2_OLEEU|nr:tyrosine DOPA decarboxylase 1-like [Olea europaea subsp. europaea]